MRRSETRRGEVRRSEVEGRRKKVREDSEGALHGNLLCRQKAAWSFCSHDSSKRWPTGRAEKFSSKTLFPGTELQERKLKRSKYH